MVALAAAGHAGATLTLTGPEALSLEEVGVAVAAATRREIPVTALDAGAFAGGLRAAGLPDGVVAAMRGTAQAVEDGLLATVTPGLERLLGRPPRTVGAVAGELTAAPA